MWVGLAVTEAITFFGLTGGLMLLFLVEPPGCFTERRPVPASSMVSRLS